jgi:hypothetical protein
MGGDKSKIFELRYAPSPSLQYSQHSFIPPPPPFTSPYSYNHQPLLFPHHHQRTRQANSPPPLILHPNRIRRLGKLLLSLPITLPGLFARPSGPLSLSPLLLPLSTRIVLHVLLIFLSRCILFWLAAFPFPVSGGNAETSRCGYG